LLVVVLGILHIYRRSLVMIKMKGVALAGVKVKCTLQLLYLV
jgi:hypothetical protein